MFTLKSLAWSQGSPLEDIYFLSQWLSLVGLTIFCLCCLAIFFLTFSYPPRFNLLYLPLLSLLHSSSYRFHINRSCSWFNLRLSILRQWAVFFYRLIYSIKYFIIKRTCSWTIHIPGSVSYKNVNQVIWREKKIYFFAASTCNVCKDSCEFLNSPPLASYISWSCLFPSRRGESAPSGSTT